MTKRTCCSWVALALALAGGARAGDQAGSAAPVPCGAEIKRFCGSVAPGDGRVLSCLRARWGELPDACRERLDRAASAAELALHVCEVDLFRFCATVPGTLKATVDCLGAHRSELAPACRTVVERARTRPQRLRQACGTEIDRSCAQVAAEDGEALTACLSSTGEPVSEVCRSALTP